VTNQNYLTKSINAINTQSVNTLVNNTIQFNYIFKKYFNYIFKKFNTSKIPVCLKLVEL